MEKPVTKEVHAMNDNSTWLILVAMVGVALAVFLFSAVPTNDVGTEAASPAPV